SWYKPRSQWSVEILVSKMATAISRFLHAARSECPTRFFHKLPELLHFGDALDGEPNDLCLGFDAKSLFGSAKRTLIDKIGFAFQLRSPCHFGPPLCHAYIIKVTGIRFKPLFRS